MIRSMVHALLIFLVLGCSTAPVRHYPDAPPVKLDQGDFRTFSPAPEEYKPSTIWDGADEILLRPVPRFFSFQPDKRAMNVNALDEVPESSWWTNRNPSPYLSVESVRKGACEKPIVADGPFEVLSAKPDGFNPGFLVRAPDGRKYFFKFDQHELQPERMSSAEVIGSLIYHSIGFTVPCYEILYFKRSDLTISKSATMKNKKGDKIPLTEEVITEAFRLAKKTADGKVRSVSSLLLSGRPLGPWTYAGTADDDPNDVIPHQHRREVRSGFVLASWISHFDTRDQNTLRTWMEDGATNQGYVRHNLLDFGDSIGNLSDEDAISRRLGYAYYLDFPYLVGDIFTLGIIKRPWDKVQYGPAGPSLGYFDIEHFLPDDWHPGYPNPAFHEMQETDGAWMARQISKFRDEHLKAIVEQAKIENTILRDQILLILKGRRDKILQRWLSKLSPLGDPNVTDQKQLCLFDYAAFSNLFSGDDRQFTSHRIDPINGMRLAPIGTIAKTKDHQVCISLGDLAKSESNYYVIEIVASPKNPPKNLPRELPLRLHLRFKDSAWSVVGLERIENPG